MRYVDENTLPEIYYEMRKIIENSYISYNQSSNEENDAF